ncbi:hypothetical protein GCM10008107_11140 [Psychrosphaera saromensis]|uniref:Uncharacterized protein n=1 Tax=Psychrosphaera saromensis TaxID=716813 RepID=A0A2S7UUI6_9GAMM|nr:hypothetical protein [Psychrosphaera saromensis]PQJ53617.1 hypothetical protein BTO11_08020 [Psychrosphaera saromensis]GHB63804.1 hypothetical protein GCM10008107_11140 [Psychrosphaera saromensis]GLQ15617.1 hypothetical protein GCM10007917_30720 [Psychrosphaera saromensis]
MNLEQQKVTDRLKVIEKKMMYLGLYNAPAMIVIAIGLFSKFGASPEALHPLLADVSLVNKALFVAVPWALFITFRSIVLALEVNKLKRG